MFPTFPVDHAIDARRANPVFTGDVRRDFTTCDARTDTGHVVGSECGVGVVLTDMAGANTFATQNVVSVFDVFRRGNNLKIAEAVVIFDAVDVIDHPILRYRSDESLDHNAMDFLGDIGLSSVLNDEDGVSIFVTSSVHQGAAPAYKQAVRVNGVTGAAKSRGPFAVCVLHES